MISEQLATLFVRLQHPANRLAVAHEIALHLGSRTMLAFMRDADGSEFVCAPGLPTNLAEKSEWQSFLENCRPIAICSSPLPDPTCGEKLPALGISDAEGFCVLVFMGDLPDRQKIHALQVLLPFLSNKLADERMLSQVAQAGRSDAEHAKICAEVDALTRRQYDLLNAYERAERELVYRRDAENKLRAADRRKDEFIATVSHELRTPLNAVLGWAELLKIKAPPDPGLAKAIDAIIRSAKTQVALINDLLDTSSIVAGKIVLHKEPLELIDVLDRARETVQPQAQQKGVQILTNYHASMVLRADSARLRQVFWNLLCNAIKFTPEGGSITIDAKADGRLAVIAIADNGMGIEPDFLPYVFDRFRQADASLRRKYGGLGLGLSIAKQFIEMHGGQVRVASEGIGKGATFTIHLPMEQGKTATLPDFHASSENDDLPDLEFIRVLAVDDDPDARELTSRMLQRCRADVTCVASAQDALDLLAAQKFDVLLSDLAMPEIDGIEFIRRVRVLRNRDRSRIPALAITAFSDAARIKQALASGFNLVLTKPLLASELGQAVAAQISRKGD